MTTYQQVGLDASSVNAAFGNWLQFRGVPRVHPTAQTTGVSYTPAQNTLYKGFEDAFKSLPELLKGARGTYEAYWEQAKKSADDYRAGKSLQEINKELDDNDVKLQYRPLLMSALEFRQGQESQQIVAQELTQKINSGEFAELSPIELDQEVTNFINDQLAGLQESYGVSGGTDAFYNGYYSQVAKTREFAQRRNDDLVEQRRRQQVEIQTKAALNEMSQIEGLTIGDIESGLKGVKDTFNLSPADEIKAFETVIAGLASNPDGGNLINEMRGLPFGDEGQTLEDFFTKAYFDSAQIDAFDTLFKANAEQMTKDIERWDSLARGGAVGRIRGELNAALAESGGLDTKKVQYLRQNLLQAQHRAEQLAKEKAQTSTTGQDLQALLGGFGSVRAVSASLGNNKEKTIDVLWSFFDTQYNRIVEEQDPEKRKAMIEQYQGFANQVLQNDYKGYGAEAIKQSFPNLNKLLSMTEGDENYLRENPTEIYSFVGGVNRESNPNEWATRKSMIDNELELYNALSNNPTVSQAILGSSHKYGGQEILAFGLKANTFEDTALNILNAKANAKANSGKTAGDVARAVVGDDSILAAVVEQYLAVHASSPEKLFDPLLQAQAVDFAAKNVEYVNPEGKNLVGTPVYGNIPVSPQYLDYVRNGLAEINARLPEEQQWDMNFVKKQDISDLTGYLVQDRVAALLRDEYKATTGSELPVSWGATHADTNSLLKQSGWSVKVDYKDFIGEAGDLIISIVDENGRAVSQNFKSYLKVDTFLDELSDRPQLFTQTLEAATGTSFERRQKMIRQQKLLQETAPFNLPKMPTISGYEAGKTKDTPPNTGVTSVGGLKIVEKELSPTRIGGR